MKTQLRLIASERSLPIRVFERLVEIAPDCLQQQSEPMRDSAGCQIWKLVGPLHDPRCRSALRYLREQGYVSGPDDRPRPSHEITIWLDRKYSMSDLATARLLMLTGSNYIDDCRWRTESKLSLRFSAACLARSKADTVQTNVPGLILPQRVREALEAQELKGLRFDEVTPIARSSTSAPSVVPWREVCDPWWELRSDIGMPPLSPTMPRLAEDGSPFTSYESQRLSFSQWPYTDIVLRYRASDLKDMPPFDLAMTHEHFGKPPCGEKLIASQRLYQVFRKHKIRAKWSPVVIEEDA